MRSDDLPGAAQEMTPPKEEISPGEHSALYRRLLQEYVDSLPLVESGRESQ